MTINLLNRIILAWIPTLSYMTLIWVLSSISFKIKFSSVPHQDKWIHLVEYAVLGLLNSYAVVRTWPKWRVPLYFLISGLLTLVWGVLDEIHQAFVPGRSADINDVAADALGAILGAGLYMIIFWRKIK